MSPARRGPRDRGPRRRTDSPGTSQRPGHDAAGPPSGAHGETARLSGEGYPGQAGVGAHTAGSMAGGAGYRRRNAGDGYPERVSEHASPDGWAGATGAPERSSEQSDARAPARRGTGRLVT